MAKLTLSDLASLQNETSAINLVNANSALIEASLENTLSRDGTTPNQMNSSLDMNSNRIINLPVPINPSDPIRLQDLINGGVAGPAGPKGSLPWVDVTAFGATGNGSTDDTDAIYTAMATIVNGVGGTLFFPPGVYIVGGGSVHPGVGIVISKSNITVQGSGGSNGTVILWAKTHNVSALTLDAFEVTVDSMFIVGAKFGCNTPALHLTNQTVECRVQNSRIELGNPCVWNEGGDNILYNNHIELSYGRSVVRSSAGALYSNRNKIDQNPPGAIPSPGYVVSAWAQNTVYPANAIVSVTTSGNSYYLQTVSGGTSKTGAEPLATDYGTAIVDNTVTWYLCTPNEYSAFLIDNSATVQFISQNDLTGLYTYGLKMESGQTVIATQNTFGLNWAADMYFETGDSVYLSNNQCAGALVSGGAGIAFGSGFTGTASVLGGQIFGSDYGIHIAGGTNYTIMNNTIFGAAVAGISVEGGISQFTIMGNCCGSSAFGANAIAIQIKTGASDYYSIIGNIIHGATSGISDGGTGTHKTLTGNQ